MSDVSQQYLTIEHFEAYGELHPEVGLRDARRLFNTLVDPARPNEPQSDTVRPYNGISVRKRVEVGYKPHTSEITPEYSRPRYPDLNPNAYAIAIDSIHSVSRDIECGAETGEQPHIFKLMIVNLSLELQPIELEN